jgi:large subunit ribosomal protein L23
MALFNRNNKTAKKPATAQPVAEVKKAAVASIARDLAHVLQHARITEKATMHQGTGVYTFNVAKSVTKNDIKQAVFALYKVTPRLVRVLKVPQKVRRNARTGKLGIKSGGKKAYVYLKKGETINLS